MPSFRCEEHAVIDCLKCFPMVSLEAVNTPKHGIIRKCIKHNVDECPDCFPVKKAEAEGHVFNIHPILMEAAKLQLKKGEDYGSTDPARREYFPYGDVSYLHVLHTKLKRLEAVVLYRKKSTNFESAHDTLLDLINYASFYASYLDQIKQKGEGTLTWAPTDKLLGELNED